jgi:DMSO/TMAO reductase YedYZ molybdopterin-dependent catalytic subunit
MRRRDLLGGAIGGAALAGGGGPAAAADTVLRQLAAPHDLATPTSYFDRLITPVPVFFVRSHFGAPALDRRRKLRVEAGGKSFEVDADGLKKFKQVKVTAVLQCSGNGRALHRPRMPGLQWQHGAMGQAEWRGVRVADLLEKAGVKPGEGHLAMLGADRPPAPMVPRYLRSLPLARALDPSTIVATHMNGAPLPLKHGAPLRIVVPGWGGHHWVKWLTLLLVQPAEAEGFYQRTAYRMPRTPIPPGTPVKPEDTVPLTTLVVKSIIARPTDGARIKAGPSEVAGVAFSGEAPVKSVEVTTDGGASWAPARLEGAAGPGRWQVFRHRFVAKAGAAHRIRVRATDAGGATQPESAAWNPSGYLWNAWHTIEVSVS